MRSFDLVGYVAERAREVLAEHNSIKNIFESIGFDEFDEPNLPGSGVNIYIIPGAETFDPSESQDEVLQTGSVSCIVRFVARKKGGSEKTETRYKKQLDQIKNASEDIRKVIDHGFSTYPVYFASGSFFPTQVPGFIAWDDLYAADAYLQS